LKIEIKQIDNVRIKPAKVSIWAYINQQEYDCFIAPNINADWPFSLKMFDSSRPVGDFIRQLNIDGSRVFLSAWSTPQLPDDILNIVPTLKYISHICGAVGFFLPRTAVERGLMVTNWGSSAGRSVAEHCLLQVLSCLRRVSQWQIELHINKGWKEKTIEAYTLFEKNVGIYGFGACAREFVNLIKPFKCNISAYSQGVPYSHFVEYNVKKAENLKELFSRNQIIINLESLIPQTYGSVTEELLRMIPQGGVFVNSGRGAVVNEAGLTKVAREGRIQIALDVFEKEPLPADSQLRGLKNVFLTPHIAGPTVDEQPQCGRAALENVAAYLLKGRPLNNIIESAKYDRMSRL
jgi:phosphoglycerate dehydrogenase-like enzyme